VSLLDPPEEAEKAIADCRNERTWPVLVGEHGGRQMMLSSPIVLYDYPALAPESQGDLCDGTEIDEILSLRIMTLTDEEKREARATDPRAGAIIDRTDAMSADALSRLHGTMRMSDFFNPADEPSPDEAFVVVARRGLKKDRACGCARTGAPMRWTCSFAINRRPSRACTATWISGRTSR